MIKSFFAVGRCPEPDPSSKMGFLLSSAKLAVYFALGSYAYGQLEGWAPLDACYFLVVTITTVG